MAKLLRLSLLLVFHVGFSANASASTFVIAKFDQTIVVGADCRSTLFLDYTKKIPGPNYCKIRNCGPGIYFAFAGTPMFNTKTNINFMDIASRACKISGGPAIKADWFERQAVESAKQIYGAEKQQTVVSAVFFGRTKVGPFFFTRSVRYLGDSDPYLEPVDCPPGCNKWNAGGYHQVIDGILKDPNFFQANGLTRGVRLLLSEEIKADKSGEIGFPISVLELDGAIENWIERGACTKENLSLQE